MKILRLLTSIVLLTIAIGTLNGCTRPGEDEFNKGIEAQRDNQLEQAKKLFHTALSKDPSLAEAHINLGYVYLREKNYDKAWEETTVGLEKDQRKSQDHRHGTDVAGSGGSGLQ